MNHIKRWKTSSKASQFHQEKCLTVHEQNVANGDYSNTVVRAPTRIDRPAGQENSKHVDAINFVVDKVMQEASGMSAPYAFIQSMWSKIESGMDSMN